MLARLSLLAAAAAAAIAVFRIMVAAVPEPYMDEIFHIPQAQRYCHGNWSYYDPKLTTPPGLYVISLGFVAPITALIDPCSTNSLRAVNIAFYIVNVLVVTSLLKRFWGGLPMRNMIEAIIISSFPVLYFFNFLYYTDAGSTCFTLVAFWLSMKDHHVFSAWFSLVAMTFRQTNVIWMMFGAAIAVVRHLSDKDNSVTKGKLSTNLSFGNLGYLVYLCYANLLYLLTLMWPYLIAMVLFVSYIIWNGGIVIGDKSNHVAQTHVMQLLYFVGFATCFLAPTSNLHENVPRFFRQLSKSVRSPLGFTGIFVALLLISFLIARFTIEHPFLLADNRHFTFYIWKYVFRSNQFFRYALIPAYLFACWLCWRQMALASSGIAAMIFFVCVALTLVPSPLLEFRYFIIPYLLLRLHVRPSSVGLLAEFLLYTIVNAFTVWLFVSRPFEWSSEPGKKQHFMY
ncbi:alpha-2-glucosyltransferase Alg10 [Chytriomyces sp. MP71]|nr:alpha-2-glucosyltransferase Alg10 [Chytriomyces sp. MP71]